MSLGFVTPGTVITRVYYAVPGIYAGQEFDDWDSAVKCAQAKRLRLVAELTESLGEFGTPKSIEDTADVQCSVELRWTMQFPDGGGLDTPIIRYRQVAKLRTDVRPPDSW